MVMAMLLTALAGCGNSSDDKGGSADTGNADVYHVGIVQQLEHPALDEATKGFQQALTDKLGKDGVNSICRMLRMKLRTALRSARDSSLLMWI